MNAGYSGEEEDAVSEEEASLSVLLPLEDVLGESADEDAAVEEVLLVLDEARYWDLMKEGTTDVRTGVLSRTTLDGFSIDDKRKLVMVVEMHKASKKKLLTEMITVNSPEKRGESEERRPISSF